MNVVPFLAATGGESNMLRIGLVLALVFLPFVIAGVTVKVVLHRRAKRQARALSDLTGATLGAHFGGDASANDGWLQSALDREEAEDETRQQWQSHLLAQEEPAPAPVVEAEPAERGSRRRLSRPFSRKDDTAEPEVAPEPAAEVYEPTPTPVASVAPVPPVAPTAPTVTVEPVRAEPAPAAPVAPVRPAPVVPPVPVAPVLPPVPAAPVAPAAPAMGAISFGGSSESQPGTDGWGESGEGSDDATSTWWDAVSEDDRN